MCGAFTIILKTNSRKSLAICADLSALYPVVLATSAATVIKHRGHDYHFTEYLNPSSPRPSLSVIVSYFILLIWRGQRWPVVKHKLQYWIDWSVTRKFYIDGRLKGIALSLNTSGIEKKKEKVRVVLRNQGSTLNNLSKIFPDIVKEIFLKTFPFFCLVVSFSNDCELFLILCFLFKLSFGFTVKFFGRFVPYLAIAMVPGLFQYTCR